MAKKCYNCGLSDNPDSANFCGKCGNKLSLLDNWKIYNASYYCLVTKSEYDKYKRLKEKDERTFFKRIIDCFFVNWYIFKGIGWSIACIASSIGIGLIFFDIIKIEDGWDFWGYIFILFCLFISFLSFAIESFTTKR